MYPVKIFFYLQDWHMKNSPAFDLLLIRKTREFNECVTLCWDGVTLPAGIDFSENVHIFCQLPPPIELANRFGARLVWVPMWDHIGREPLDWWRKWPNTMRVLAFSKAIAWRARTAGLPVLQLQFFLNPDDYPEADWSGERKLLYWNRTGLISTGAIKRLCSDLNINSLLWRRKLDPQIPIGAKLKLDDQFCGSNVVRLPAEMDREQFMRWENQANVMIAPRQAEGAGMVMLEGLVRGCCVLGWDAPTMNEYVVSGENGFLFQPQKPGFWEVNMRRVKWQLGRVNGTQSDQHYFPVFHPNQWRGLNQMDLAALGRKARHDHGAGYRRWKRSIPAMLEFLTRWSLPVANYEVCGSAAGMRL